MTWSRRRLEAVEEPAAGHHDAGRGQHRLGLGLVHGQRRGQDAGVGVGDGQRLQHALDAAVLAPVAVQGVEADVGLQAGQHLGQVAAGVDAADLGAQPLQRLGAAAAGDQQTSRSEERPPSRTATWRPASGWVMGRLRSGLGSGFGRARDKGCRVWREGLGACCCAAPCVSMGRCSRPRLIPRRRPATAGWAPCSAGPWPCWRRRPCSTISTARPWPSANPLIRLTGH